MAARIKGAYMVSWTQTEIDGLPDAPVSAVKAGASWSWSGEAVRIDGPQTVLQLGASEEHEDLRRRAGRMARRLSRAPLAANDSWEDEASVQDEMSFLLTDGAQRYMAFAIPLDDGQPPLLLFKNAVPPKRTELWVVNVSPRLRRLGTEKTPSSAMICFTPGTLIRTEGGDVPVELLVPGDRVLTKDDGPLPIEWRGQRDISGARLFAMPHLRPIRLRTHAFFPQVPSEDLFVSPDHQLLLRGRAADQLFGTPEVLVPAKCLVNNRTITVDHHCKQVRYLHLMLDRHAIVWANGLETETFHPAELVLSPLSRK